MKPRLYFLPLEDFHIVPIQGLSAEAIKWSADKIFRDRKSIKRSTILNVIAKAFGIKGGFARYKSVETEQIDRFLKNHGLLKQSNLITPRKTCMESLQPKVTAQQISERLFLSGKPIPAKIFTGYDFDFKNRYEDGMGIVNFWEQYILSSYTPRISIHNSVIENHKLMLSVPKEASIKIREHSSRTMEDIFLGNYIFQFCACFNMMSDAIVHPKYESCYFANPYEYMFDWQVNSKELDLIFSVFRKQMESSDTGWVEVIPYNDNLIFLKGKNGEYDFVFRELRDEKFEHHSVFSGKLKNADTPSQLDTYHFARWYYFLPNIWREFTEYSAYADVMKNWDEYNKLLPGYDKMLSDYLNKKGKYKKPHKKGMMSEGFVKARLPDKTLCVSDLITIGDFNAFRTANPDYFKYRKGDKLSSMNQDGEEMPVTVTWYDANAYAAWVEKKINRPVRLLTKTEYRELRSPVIMQNPMERFFEPFIDPSTGEAFPGASSLKKDIIYEIHDSEKSLLYYDTDMVEFKNGIPYMEEEKFQEVIVKFGPYRKQVTQKCVNYLISNGFGEWMFDHEGNSASALRISDIKPCHPDDLMPADSTGKYKYCKIGFRLCFEAVD